nr:MAG TPA: hypothetical protein [Caudoviricetes sp.]
MKKQVDERMALIAEMQAVGAIATPVSHLKTPALLVAALEVDGLKEMQKNYKKSRKRQIPFSLNGRTYLLPRREALALVDTELKNRLKTGAQS